MAQFIGNNWTRAELSAQVGHMRQIAGVRATEFADGPARGARAFHVYTGSGLAFDVLADRALDLSHVTYKGRSLTWSSSSGDSHPAYFESAGLGWLRSFPGGMLTTCGLDTFGSPSEDAGESFGIHGRASNLPAEQVGYRESWDGDDYLLEISGQVRQARLFGENLTLHRRITTALGSNAFTVTDTVTNDGFASQPHMILYHCNLGFPLLSADAELIMDAAETHPRDADAEKGVDNWNTFHTPTAGYAEQVFRHVVTPDAEGNARAELRNPATGLALSITYSFDTLPHLFQWKMMGQGAYVLGVEPANSSAVEGRSVARARDDLPMLEPGDTRAYRLTFEVTEL